jgi:hypothetical protein
MDPFLLKLLLSFLVGSTWVTLASVLAEKYGTKIGGVITGLPSTALLALLFIGWVFSTQDAVEATTLTPIIAGVIAISMIAYIALLRFNFWIAFFGSLIIWLLLSLGIYFSGFADFTISLISYVVLLSLSYVILERVFKIKSELRRTVQYTLPMLLTRGLFSGAVVAFAVLMSKIGGPLLGGVFAFFPAVFLGTIIITYLTHGPSFSSSVMKVAILGGASTVVFAVVARFTFIPFGIWLGALVSLVVSLVVAYLIFIFVKKKML